MLIAWLGLGIKNPLGYDEENITFGLRYLLWSPQTWLEKSEVLIKTYYVVAKKRKKNKTKTPRSYRLPDFLSK